MLPQSFLRVFAVYAVLATGFPIQQEARTPSLEAINHILESRKNNKPISVDNTHDHDDANTNGSPNIASNRAKLCAYSVNTAICGDTSQADGPVKQKWKGNKPSGDHASNEDDDDDNS